MRVEDVSALGVEDVSMLGEPELEDGSVLKDP